MKLAIAFGGTYDMYEKHAKIFDLFDEHFERKGNSYKCNGNEFKIFFAFGPKRCGPLEFSREYVGKFEKLPPPAEVLSKG